MTPEAKVKSKVRRILKAHGCFVGAVPGGMYGQNGMPDYVGCLNSVFLGVEVKAGKNKATKLQRKILDQINTAGGVGMVVSETELDLLSQTLELIAQGEINAARDHWIQTGKR